MIPTVRIVDFHRALHAVEQVLAENGHRGDAWRRESVYSHVSHLIAHAETWRAERQLEDLAHGAVRALMALELALAEAEAAPKGAICRRRQVLTAEPTT